MFKRRYFEYNIQKTSDINIENTIIIKYLLKNYNFIKNF